MRQPIKTLHRTLCALLLTGAAALGHAGTATGTQTSQNCAYSDIQVAGLDGADFSCTGLLSGNLLNSANATLVAQVLSSLTGDSWTSSEVSTATADNKISLSGGSTVDFSDLLYGMTLVGIHKGKGGQGGIEGTVFYYFDAGTDGLDTFLFLLAGSSDAVLYSTGEALLQTSDEEGTGPVGSAVPEPGSVGLVLAGLGAAGFAARRRVRR